MRLLTLTLLALLPLSAFATDSTTETKRARRAAIQTQELEAACKTELGFSDAQMKRGTFIEILRKCVSQKVNVIEQQRQQETLKSEREEFLEKATKSFQARMRGATPEQRNTQKSTPVVRKVPAKRLSTRARRLSAQELKSTTQVSQPPSSSSVSSSASSASSSSSSSSSSVQQ